MKKSKSKSGQKLLRDFSRGAAKLGEGSKAHIRENLISRISHIENVRLLIFEWVLLVAALLMLAIAQAFWFSDSYAEDTYSSGGSYSEATIGGVGSLNPLFAVTDSEKTLSRLLFATLGAVDYSGRSGLGLAESIIPSENGKVWTVKLRDGLRWSDGEPLTNADVLFTIDLIKNPAVKSIYNTTNLTNVATTENDQGEIVFTLPKPYADFVSALNIPILPKHKLEQVDPKNLAENEFSTNPVTSGPFKFNALQTTGSSDERVFYLSANPYYYGGEPLLASFAVHTYPNKAAVIKALNAGEVTATAELTDAEGDQVTSGQLLRKDSGLNSGVYLFFNTKSDKVSNKDLRAAMRQGLDLAAVRAASPNTTALDYPLLESQIALENYPALPAQDFAAAEVKIRELTGDNPPTLEIATLNTGYLPEVTSEIASQLGKLGFKTNVSIYEEQDQDFITQRAYDLLVFEIDLGADPDLFPYYHSSHASSAGLNLSNYSSALVDDLLLGARDTMDPTLRAKKYETFLNYWVNDVPAVGLFQSNLTYYYNRNARIFGNNVRLVTSLDRFTDVVDWAVNRESKSRTP